MAAQQQQMEMQRTLFDQQQQAMQAQQQRGQEMQGALMTIYDRLSDGTLSPEDVFQFQMAFPEAAEEFRAAYEGYTNAQMQGTIAEQSSLIAAVASNPAIAQRMFERQLAAAEASGDEEGIIGAKTQISLLNQDPNALLAGLLVEFANIPDIDQKVVENVMKAAMPSRDAASVEGKIFQDYQSGRFGDPQSPEAQRVLTQALDRARGPQVQVTVGADGRPYQYLEQLPPGAVVPTDLLGGYAPGKDRVAIRDPSDPRGFREEIVTGSTTDLAQKQRALNTETVGSIMFEDLNFALDLLGAGAPTGPAIAGAIGPQRERGLSGVVQGMVRGALSETNTLAQVLRSIESNVTVDQIQRAREASPTGGLMGNMSERQSDMMGTLLGQITIDMPSEVLKQNLIRLQNLTMDSVHGTPAEISELERQGKVNPELAKVLSYRTPTTYQAAPVGARRGVTQDMSPQSISSMNKQQIESVDPATLNADQTRAYISRMRQLMGE
jgi:hypothetical protein